MRRLFYCLFAVGMLMPSAVHASSRERACFDRDWLFILADSASMSAANYDDHHWRHLDLPHDWAIEGDFSPSNPSGAGGGALPGGIGWYRKHFRVGDAEKYYIEFDGVYMNSTVYINGHALGTRPYGYSTFQYDVTPYLNRHADNVVAVKVDNSDQPNSRWYSGCGIYRHVWLTSTSRLHIDHWGVYVKTTPTGNMTIETRLMDERSSGAKPVIRHTVTDPSGREVASNSSSAMQCKLKVRKPRLWSVDDPYIYKVSTEIWVDGQCVDEYSTTTGFREIRFDASKGFFLNGKSMKINGVCEHHDLGCLGAAIYEDALHRKLVILKQMGVNAIRCSHNPPAPELLNMCDTMGLMVRD